MAMPDCFNRWRWRSTSTRRLRACAGRKRFSPRGIGRVDVREQSAQVFHGRASFGPGNHPVDLPDQRSASRSGHRFRRRGSPRPGARAIPRRALGESGRHAGQSIQTIVAVFVASCRPSVCGGFKAEGAKVVEGGGAGGATGKRRVPDWRRLVSATAARRDRCCGIGLRRAARRNRRKANRRRFPWGSGWLRKRSCGRCGGAGDDFVRVGDAVAV